jgi:hypothetical protein
MISTFKLSPSNSTESSMSLINKFTIEGTRNTPWVMYDGTLGILEIKGISSPESSINFYNKILNQLDILSATVIPSFQFNVELTYFNTSSAKCLFDIFKKLIKLSQNSTNVVINWYYEEGDEDMLESGEDFADITSLKFNFIETE